MPRLFLILRDAEVSKMFDQQQPGTFSKSSFNKIIINDLLGGRGWWLVKEVPLGYLQFLNFKSSQLKSINMKRTWYKDPKEGEDDEVVTENAAAETEINGVDDEGAEG